jgi:hypothetical protein
MDWSRRCVLITAHRRESFGKGMEDICLAIKASPRGPLLGCRPPSALRRRVQLLEARAGQRGHLAPVSWRSLAH